MHDIVKNVPYSKTTNLVLNFLWHYKLPCFILRKFLIQRNFVLLEPYTILKEFFLCLQKVTESNREVLVDEVVSLLTSAYQHYLL